MLTLALETGTRLASVALGEAAALLGESLLPSRAARSETVLPEVERMLRACGREAEEVTAVVIGAGPGSFTGLRVAASLAKGFCFARGLPLYAYSGLAAIAAGAGTEEPVCALLDARRGQVYWAVYRVSERLEEIAPPAVSAIERALARPAPAAGRVFAGEGAIRHSAAIREAGGRVLPPHLGVPRAGSLLWLAHAYPEAGRVRDVEGWEPRYLRLPSAEREAGAAR